jgi:hypothetical protein
MYKISSFLLPKADGSVLPGSHDPLSVWTHRQTPNFAQVTYQTKKPHNKNYIIEPLTSYTIYKTVQYVDMRRIIHRYYNFKTFV